MCELCRSYPCKSNCPNAPEAEYICEECGYGIEYGQHIYHLGGYTFCESCVENAAEYYEEPAEPDAMDVYKAYIEREMCDEL